MIISKKSYVFFLVVFVSVTITGCKDPVEPIPQVEITLFGSMNQEELWKDTIAVFDTPWGKPLNLELAKHVKFTIPSTGIYQTNFNYESSEQKEIYILEGVRYEGDPKTRITSHLVTSTEKVIPNENKINLKHPSSTIANYYLFFLEGFGDVPSSAIEVSYIPQNNNFEEIPGRVTVEINPDDYTVRNTPTLYLNWNDLKIDQNSDLFVQFEFKRLTEDFDYQPLFIARENDQYRWKISSSSNTVFSFYSLGGIPVNEHFELFMYTIDSDHFK